jgi:tRNA C32,U32 (ribose-2'-O)-methylase TrmJ
LLIGTESFSLRAADKPLTEKGKIEALIKHLENLKDATFIRNDSNYEAKTAARFLRGKWQAQEKEIKTAMDFIEKVASVSSTSGKPYVIRFKNAREVKCGKYLIDELKKLEKDKPEKPKDAA